MDFSVEQVKYFSKVFFGLKNFITSFWKKMLQVLANFMQFLKNIWKKSGASFFCE
jgi:hypothetical protein